MNGYKFINRKHRNCSFAKFTIHLSWELRYTMFMFVAFKGLVSRERTQSSKAIQFRIEFNIP